MRQQRLTTLDSLRGIAAMAVVVYHFTANFDEIFRAQGPWEAPLINFGSGRYGVQLFFVISGFVILWSIGKVDRLWDFASGRFARLYPPFWFALGATCLIITLGGLDEAEPLRFNAADVLANITMVPSWFGRKEIDGSYWTLSVEMLFYIVLAVLFTLKLLRVERVVWTLAALWTFNIVIVGGLAFAQDGFGGLRGQSEDYYYLFIAGMAYFLLWEGRARPRIVLWGLYLQAPFVDLLRQRLMPAIVTVMIIVAVHLSVTGRLAFLEARPFVFLGRISYSLYLVHQVSGYLTLRFLLRQGLERNTAVVVCIVQSIALGWLLWRTFERGVSPWVKARLVTPGRPTVKAASA